MAAGRGRKISTVLLVLLLVLVGLFVAGDRFAAYAASKELANQAQKELAARNITTPDRPRVTIAGFPFLTQVIRGRYDRVTIHATNLTGQGVTLDTLNVVATGITAKASTLINRQGDITAANVDGTAHLGWGAVTSLIKTNGTGMDGVTISPLSNGQIEMKTPVRVLGVTTDVVATGTVHVTGSVVHVSVTRVQAQGGVIPAALNPFIGTLKTALSVNVRIPALPYNMKITDVQTATDGIVVNATAQNVTLAARSGA